MESAIDKKKIFKLSLVFALIYFFSPNGIASLPGLTISYLLKDVLHMSASAASYFGAVTIIGWAIKPLWGIISDTFPIFGYRRKSYLIVTTVGASIVWLILGLIENYSVGTLIILFTLSSMMYAFMDVLCDAIMIETGKPLNLTGRFQSVQWTAVYIASIITGLAGGYLAANWEPGQVFLLNAIFPTIILITVICFIKENRVENNTEGRRESWAALRAALHSKNLWLLAFFLFFWTFSPSFGAPFFYFAVDTLKFEPTFFGLVGAIGAASAAIGAIIYGKWNQKWNTRKLIHFAIAVGTISTLFDLFYFTNFITTHLEYAKWIFAISSAILGAIGSITFLVMLNAAATYSPEHSEGSVFATLTSFWNIGLMGASVLGGFLFDKIGLQPLIIVSAIFTAATWLILPYLKLSDDKPKVI